MSGGGKVVVGHSLHFVMEWLVCGFVYTNSDGLDIGLVGSLGFGFYIDLKMFLYGDLMNGYCEQLDNCLRAVL